MKFGENPREFWIHADDVYSKDINGFPIVDQICPGQKITIEDHDDLYNNYNKDCDLMKKVKGRVASKLPPVAVVQEIVPHLLEINWFLIGSLDGELPSEVHPSEVSILKNPSRYRRVSIGNRLQFKNKQESIKYIDKERSVIFSEKKSKTAKKRNRYFKFLNELPNYCGIVIDLNTLYEVTWQDGSISNSVKSTDLLGYDPSGVNEFWPKSIVCRASDEIDKSSWGVVQSTNIDDQIVHVKWIKEKGNILHDNDESLSLYSLVTHPDLSEIIPEKLVIRSLNEESLITSVSGEVIEMNKNGKCSVYWFDDTQSDMYIDELRMLDDEFNDDDCCDYDSDYEEFSDGESEAEEIDKIEITKIEEEINTENNETLEEEEGTGSVTVESIKDLPSYPYLNKFEHFAICDNTPVHYFLAESQNLPPRSLRVIMKETNSILKKNLPEGAFVRAFGSNLDLLQVLIIGPRNTPYRL